MEKRQKKKEEEEEEEEETKRDFLGRCCGVASALPTEVYWHPHSAYQRNLALPAAAKWHKGRWDWALALANKP
uniref:Uncharacterized protein n=1 Tax=Vespula pensylvanica TaxID=30213 RepID=A0A834UC53_VESPE|nr:hypothetical protein H0235_005906 [Vespula pensylvanica]